MLKDRWFRKSIRIHIVFTDKSQVLNLIQLEYQMEHKIERQPITKLSFTLHIIDLIFNLSLKLLFCFLKYSFVSYISRLKINLGENIKHMT